MINPYREAAPWARLVTLLVLGAVLLYGLARWDRSIDRRLAELKAETARVIEIIRSSREWADSVRALEDSLGAVDAALALEARRARAALEELHALAQAEVDSVASSPLDDLLPPLRMRPILVAGDTVYGTDSTGVRILSARMLRLAQVERELPVVRDLADTRADRIGVLTLQVAAVSDLADTLQAQLNLAEPVLEAWQKHSSCKILGLVSCPSRTTSYIIGVVTGGIAVYAASRD